MLCENLYQLNHVFQRHDFHPSPSDLIHIVCGHCEKTEVCPAGQINENAELPAADRESAPQE